MASIAQACNTLAPSQSGVELHKALADVLTDLTALRTSITGITAKLDLDGGVTGTDFASLHNPAALTTKA